MRITEHMDRVRSYFTVELSDRINMLMHDDNGRAVVVGYYIDGQLVETTDAHHLYTAAQQEREEVES